MTEPLLATARRARRAAHGRRAAVGRAGVPRDAAGRRGDRAAVRARPARLGRAAARRRPSCAAASTSPTCCPTRSSRRSCRGWRASRCASAIAAKAAVCCSTGACANPAGRPPMVAFYGALAGATVRPRRAGRSCSLDAAATRCDARGAGLVSAARYWAFAPGAEYGPAKCWPAAALRRAGARAARARRPAGRCCSARPRRPRLCEEIAAPRRGACRVLAGKTSLLDAMALIAAARGAGQQRLGADARRRRRSACRRSRCSARPARCTRRRSTRARASSG